jgi:hypothetical protein
VPFDAATGDLRPWLEVIVEDATLEYELIERVRSFSEGKAFDVLKVLRGKSAPISGMTVGEATDDEAIESLLDQPALVFEHMLSEHKIINDEEIESLKTAFAVLVDLDKQSEPSVSQ